MQVSLGKICVLSLLVRHLFREDHLDTTHPDQLVQVTVSVNSQDCYFLRRSGMSFSSTLMELIFQSWTLIVISLLVCGFSREY